MSQEEQKVAVTVINKFRHLKIYLNGFLHLSLPLNEVVAIQSYKSGYTLHHIDFYMKTTKVDCEYEKEEVWKDILKELDKIVLVEGK